MSEVTTITLHALEGEPLRHDLVCEMVEATARAIAERQGIELLDLSSDARSITATLGVSRVAALGFAAELRRLTTKWYQEKFDRPTLWGEPSGTSRGNGEDADDGAENNDEHWLGDPEGWKRA